MLIGYGDPVDGGGRVVNPDALGMYKSATAGGTFNFEKIYEGSVTCITWTALGVYVCTSQEEKKFAVGFAPQPDFTLANAAPLTPLLRLQDVKEPLPCPACTTGAACPADWANTQVCEIFAGCPDGGSAAGSGGAQDCDGAAGSTGGMSAGGVGGTGTGGSSGGRDGGPAAGPAFRELSDDSGCGCQIPGSGLAASYFAALLAGLVALFLRSATRRRSS